MHRIPPSGARTPRAGMTLFEVVLAMAILVSVAGGVLLTIRTSVETSVRVARVRDDDAILYSFVELMRETFRNLPGTSTLVSQSDSTPGQAAQRLVIDEPGPAWGFGRVTFDRQRVVFELERAPGGLWAAQLVAFPRIRKLGEKPVPLVLIDDLERLTWRFFDSRSQSWQEDWTDGGFRPTVIELTLRRLGRPEVVQMFEVMPKPAAVSQGSPNPQSPPPVVIQP